jgi:hypothetical protein
VHHFGSLTCDAADRLIIYDINIIFI